MGSFVGGQALDRQDTREIKKEEFSRSIVKSESEKGFNRWEEEIGVSGWAALSVEETETASARPRFDESLDWVKRLFVRERGRSVDEWAKKGVVVAGGCEGTKGTCGGVVAINVW
jgi:hypothetical protein